MDLPLLTSDQRAEIARRALDRARVIVENLSDNDEVKTIDELFEQPFGVALHAALWILDEGRRYATTVLESCDEFVRTIGSDTDEVQQELLAHVDHAIVRLRGGLELRPEPEAIPCERRLAILHRALSIAHLELSNVPADAETLTDRQYVALALITTTERLLLASQQHPTTRCSWCSRAGVPTPPLRRDSPEMLDHLFSCSHSPAAAAHRALTDLRALSRNTNAGIAPPGAIVLPDGSTLGEWLDVRLVEIEALRLGKSAEPRPSHRATLEEVLERLDRVSMMYGPEVQELADFIRSRLS